MLLRLLPTPTSANPTPATILFTLPMTTSPYTGKGLPLPPNLLSHRSFCMQEGIECSNVLLGDKATWISGIVDEVTFCLQTSQITVHLIDGSSVALPVSKVCQKMLHVVIEHVQLSFAPPQAPVRPSLAPSAIAGPSTSKSRSPSALLLTLLSPLLAQPHNTPTVQPQAPQTSSRLHRRQARSVLVDAFRAHVLPALKEVLPQSYLLWTLQVESDAKQVDWENTKAQVENMLNEVGLTAGVRATASGKNLGRSVEVFGESTSSLDCSSESDDDSTPPMTPATSIWNTSTSSSTPLAHLSSLPATSSIPSTHRSNYAGLVARLSALASRLSNLKKIKVHMEREDARRKWLESMEASRMAERGVRRSWSLSNNAQGIPAAAAMMASRPAKSSSLWRSTTPSTINNESAWSHPVMQEVLDESEVSMIIGEEEGDPFASDIIVRPISPTPYSSASAPVSSFAESLQAPPLVPSLSQSSLSSCEDDSETDSMSGHSYESTFLETPVIVMASPARGSRRAAPKIWTAESAEEEGEEQDISRLNITVPEKKNQRVSWGGPDSVRIVV